ncbi:YBR242W and YGL101W [Zygosaccharomyces parabailii]|nr:YBR242W and YGL101W [Zygosaccharomyces parabailii]
MLRSSSLRHISHFSIRHLSSTMHSDWNPRDHLPQDVKLLLTKPQHDRLLAFHHIVGQLKVQRRTGWLDHDINDCESISDHMYRMGIMSMLIKNPMVNRDKCVRIALVHDIAESLVGDITPFDPVTKEEKHRREWETIQFLCDEFVGKSNQIAAKEMMSDWLAYENISSLEARYVKDIDKYEMLVQCFEYEKRLNDQNKLKQFWSAVSNIKTEEVKDWAQGLLDARAEFFES